MKPIRAEQRVLFARVGWMRWYRGPQPDDPKPLGGGKYTRTGLGGEAHNFLPIGDKLFAYFQPQLQPLDRREAHPSFIRLEKIQPGCSGDSLNEVLVVFVARNPGVGGQYIVGWYRNPRVYRREQESYAKERNEHGYFIEATVGDGVLVPETRRAFSVPRGKGGFGQANICYGYDDDGKRKQNTDWMDGALEYVSSYQHENPAEHPASETDHDISEQIGSTIERAAGYQSNPRIRAAIEDYAMKWAFKRLSALGLCPADKHKTMPYDFLCTAEGAELFVEVKGTQEDGKCVSLTPNEVKHAKEHTNSALFIVHSVDVHGKKAPRVSGGEELFLNPWNIDDGKLEPGAYAFTLPQRIAAKLVKKQAATGKL
jgi:hypothetical protein